MYDDRQAHPRLHGFRTRAEDDQTTADQDKGQGGGSAQDGPQQPQPRWRSDIPRVAVLVLSTPPPDQ